MQQPRPPPRAIPVAAPLPPPPPPPERTFREEAEEEAEVEYIPRVTRSQRTKKSVDQQRSPAAAASGVSSIPEGARKRFSPSSAPIRQQCDLSLPYYERYQAQLRGRAPYHCIPCDKPLARSTLPTHVKNKHGGGKKKKGGDSHRVDCVICGEKFVGSELALEHVTQYHK